MKKLMIAFAAVAMGLSASAANFARGLTEDNPRDPSGTSLTDNGGRLFLYLGTVGQTDNKDGTYTLNFAGCSLIDTLQGNGGAWSNWDYENNTDSRVTQPNLDGTEGVQDFSLILVNDGTVTDLEGYEGKYTQFDVASYRDLDGTSGTEYAAIFFDEYRVKAGDWKTASAGGDVPEPTSGLLLLLGMAGLALRRRRA